MSDGVLKLADLGDARDALQKLLPHLPLPRLSEHVDACGIPPMLDAIASDALPVMEHPLSLIRLLRPDESECIPPSWHLALQFHERRRTRAVQYLVAHAECERLGEHAAPAVSEIDPVVAGALLATIRPLPGPLRSTLMRRVHAHWWGAFYALHGLVLADEADALRSTVAQDPRLAAALWLREPELVGPLASLSLTRNDIWSAVIALHQAEAEPWLTRIVMAAATNPVAGVTAITLQPRARAELRRAWIQGLAHTHPMLACLAARWSRHTWMNGWEKLREQLRLNATRSSQGHFHYFRDVEPERAEAASQDANADLLWRVELIDHHNLPALALHATMLQRATTNPADFEARLVLRWFDQRAASAL